MSVGIFKLKFPSTEMTYEAHTLIAPMAYTCCCVGVRVSRERRQRTFGQCVCNARERGHVGSSAKKGIIKQGQMQHNNCI